MGACELWIEMGAATWEHPVAYTRVIVASEMTHVLTASGQLTALKSTLGPLSGSLLDKLLQPFIRMTEGNIIAGPGGHY